MIKRQKLATAAPVLIFGALILILIVGLRHNNGGVSKFAQHVGDPVPLTDLATMDGSGAHFTTQSWRGRPYVVNFFASWCADCRLEHEELMTLAATHIPLIGITYKDRVDKTKVYLDKLGNPFVAVAQDQTGRTGIDWGLTGVPETFVIDSHGIIRWHYIGGLTDAIVTSELMPVWESVAR